MKLIRLDSEFNFLRNFKRVVLAIYETFLIKKSQVYNRNRIIKLKNMYKGKRIFIIGGGPSINNMDLSLLNNEYTIVVNRGFLLKDKGLKHATMYGISDENSITEYGNKIDPSYADLFCSFRSVAFPFKANTVQFPAVKHIRKVRNMMDGEFQLNAVEPLAGSFTVVLYMLQVAVWMGFKEIYFIGIDNNFGSKKNLHWYKDSTQEQKNMESWNFNPSESNNIAFKNAYNILKMKGVNIYNAGIGGELNSIPRVEYTNLFNQSNEKIE
jgi:hypothetical protein